MNVMLSACKVDYLRIVKKIMEEIKHSEDEKKEFLRKGFLAACRYGSLDVVKYLVDILKCDIHVKDEEQKNGLMWASFAGNLKMVTYLTKIGCDVFEKNPIRGCTCFCYACGSTEISVVKFLVNFGADINEIDANGRSALLHAIHSHHIPMKKFLINPKTHLKLIEFLISSGCDFFEKDENGDGPAQIAFQDGFIDATVQLIEYGCEFSKKFSKNGGENKKEKKIYEKIKKRIEEIEKSENVMKHILQDVDIQMVNLISQFSFGLKNLKNVILVD
jgi:ankyrin repeat protein